MIRSFPGVAIASVSLLFCVPVCAQAAAPAPGSADWASWRGPLGDGVATGAPPLRWAEKTEDRPAQNIAWKVPVPGLGISTPIVWRDRIYLTTAIQTDRKGTPEGELEPQHPNAAPRPDAIFEFVVLALRRSDGGTVWQRKVTEAVPHEGGHRTNSHASSSPVTDGESLFVNFGSRGLYCLDLAGKVRWSKRLGIMRTRRQYGEASSPCVYGDRLIVNWDHEGDSFLVVFDKRTGKELWRQPRDEVTSWSTPIVVPVDSKKQIIVAATTASRGYDLETGKVIWSLPGMTVNCIPIPIHRDGIVYVMSGYRGQMLQAIRLAGARGVLTDTEHVVWSHQRNTSYVPSAALAPTGHLFFLRGNNAVLSCLEASTGKVVFEGRRIRGLRQVYASPLYAQGRLYVTSREGITKVVSADAKCEELATNRIDEPVDASMAVVGDTIYLRGHRHLYAIAADANKGKTPAKEPSPQPKKEPAVVR